MNILQSFVVDPLYDLYIHIPYVGWSGKSKTQICSLLTGIGEKYWIFEGADECELMVEKQFKSKLILLRSVLHIYVISVFVLDLYDILRQKILSFFFGFYNNAMRRGAKENFVYQM
tara:strand:- start:5793 stop:6140 length:348 start_codon:yes stop_codon:yes gene_type:complete